MYQGIVCSRWILTVLEEVGLVLFCVNMQTDFRGSIMNVSVQWNRKEIPIYDRTH